jgi:hypothetical protein
MNYTDNDEENIAWWNSLTYEEKVNHADAMGMLDHMSEEERAAELIRLGIIRGISSSYDMFLISNKRIFCEGRYA